VVLAALVVVEFDTGEVLVVELGSSRSAYRDVMPRAPVLEDVMSAMFVDCDCLCEEEEDDDKDTDDV